MSTCRRLLWLVPLFGAWMIAGVVRAGRAPGRMIDDEPALLHFAHRILHGGYATTDSLNGITYLWHGPGLPLLLAPFVWMHVPIAAMRLVTGPVMLCAAIIAFERLLRLRLSERAALAGAYLLGLYLPFGYLLDSLTKEELAVALVVLAMHGTTRGLREGRKAHMVGAGIALGALVYVRLEYGWVLLAMAAATGAYGLLHRGRRAPRRLLAICSVAIACCLPWLVYTEHLSGRVLYWGNAGGLSMYWMSSPSPDQYGEWHAVHSVFQRPELARYRPLFRRTNRLAPIPRDIALQHVALRQIRANPEKYELNLVANTTRMLFAAPMGFPLPHVVLALYVLCEVQLLTLVGWALVRLRRARRWPVEGYAFALFAGLGFAVHIPLSAEPRMLMPLVPVLVWLAVHGWNAGPPATQTSRATRTPIMGSRARRRGSGTSPDKPREVV